MQWTDPDVLNDQHSGDWQINGDCWPDPDYKHAVIRLSNLLKREEAKAVILHELSHIRFAALEKDIENAFRARPRLTWAQFRRMLWGEFERIAQADSQTFRRLVK